jgi:hypothetical protein
MQITANTIYFFISYAVAFLVFGHWQMVRLAEHQGSRTQACADPTPALLMRARQWLDVPDARACLAGATQRVCRTNRLW